MPEVQATAALAQEVLDLAKARGLTVAVAESLTGGRLAAALTSRAGSSAVFRGSVTAYATELKAAILGVDADLLARVGAVDGEVAAQMAAGVRRVCGSDIGIATTGVAGPDPQDGKDVGTVYIAVSGAGAIAPATSPPASPGTDAGAATGITGANTVLLLLSGDRSSIQDGAVNAALELAVRYLKS